MIKILISHVFSFIVGQKYENKNKISCHRGGGNKPSRQRPLIIQIQLNL